MDFENNNNKLMNYAFSRFKTDLFCRILVLYLLSVSAPDCFADLVDLKVYSPLVEKGELAFEVLGNTTFDGQDSLDGFQYHEFEFEYGVTDWWASSLTNSIIKNTNENIKYNVLGWENTFQFTEEGKYWLDLGMHIELELGDERSEADQVEVRFLFRKAFVTTEHIFNVNFEQEFGHAAEESLELEYMWRSKFRIDAQSEIGLKAFGSMGEIKSFDSLNQQEHVIGPAYYRDFGLGDMELETQVVWLFGLTDESAGHTFRWQLEFEF